MDDLPTPTARELEILKALWDRGPSSVRAVHAALAEQGEDDLAYNTVQTMLRLMEAKQLVSHHTDGRTFIYTPRYSREESAARFLDRVFDGAASELMLTLIRAERIPAAELDRMHALIAAARGGRRNGGAA
ncbi:MAG: BlaI/MecI/CopY family transcriptional regulator [Zavarzinella sp.]|nr:BlaI/MecI/CopY family transcriptional regulator [Zavarzinella sp.]